MHLVCLHGVRTLKDALGFFWTLLYALFPLLALCPFAIINLSCEHDYVLSPMSLTDLVVSIGTPNTSRSNITCVGFHTRRKAEGV